jgi:hypothetical protein
VGKSPLAALQVGQEVTAVAFPAARKQRAQQAGAPRELSVRPSLLAAAGAGRRVVPLLTWSSVTPGERYVGAVSEVHAAHAGHPAHAVVALSSEVRGHVSVLMADSEPEHLTRLAERLPLGSLVGVTAIAVNARQQRLDLSLLPHPEFALLAAKGGEPQVRLSSKATESHSAW